MSTTDTIRHKFMMWSAVIGLLTVAASALWLHSARTGLSGEVYEESAAACSRTQAPDACRDRVDELHDDCFRWSLTRHDEHPKIDRDKYDGCLEHPPGKFRDSAH